MSQVISAELLQQLCLNAGADDVGLVSISRAEMDCDRDDILNVAPWTKTLLSFVVRMNREPIRSPARSIANLEFHDRGENVDEVARKVVTACERQGIRAINPAMGFPMEIQKFPGKIWTVSHKLVAEAAGLGKMGIHRNLIHPQFGNFILLGTVLIDQAFETESQPIDYNPCLSCKLCVAACPVGAIGSDGYFNFNACYTHNYREFMGGFNDWTEQVAESKSRNDFRTKVSDSENASIWQSLSFGANYKAAYCMAVCPAGEDVIAPWREDKKQFVADVVKPLQQKTEDVYVIAGSDAETIVQKRFKNKRIRKVRGSLHVRTIQGFLDYLGLQFQPGQAKGLDAIYHFIFTGKEQKKATIRIKNQRVSVQAGLHDQPNLRVTADSQTWLKFLAREKSLPIALLTFKLRLRGSPSWLMKFGDCFPS